MSRALAALRKRGLLAGLTHEHASSVLDAAVKKHQDGSSQKAVGVYCGFDPTASSLHVGNLVTVMALRHFQLAGIKPILLVGGATGMIGDPSMRSDERVMLTAEEVDANSRNLVNSLKNVLDFDCPKVGAEVANNMSWHGKISVVDWMRECGAYARVNAMLARDSVKRRLDADAGLSFLEFSYQLFQAYDFLHLHRHHNVVVQVGGSDQWGNIVAGCDLVRKADGGEVYGVTVPLLTTANGEKFGKSAGNAVWLDSSKTSVYDFYQYFIRTDDADVATLLKTFTLLDVDEIDAIVADHAARPEDRRAQQILAEHATKMIHGSDALKAAQVAANVLFGGSLDGVTASDILAIDAPRSGLRWSELQGKRAVDVLATIGAIPSKAEGRRLIKAGGVYVNNVRVDSDAAVIDASQIVQGRAVLVRVGKRNYHVIHVTDA
ncbi:tyrosine-tRNA ligase [Aphanomyces invadans]|uniref:Tyrosine--tRNA ligase n=1 Tax=Aphanomyces invadans TaxID=157072 RepID=A0A024UD97_9STRA|nr:tyrosine-tRNA ligase [Aphanomyces invadans]ETW03847.1 tyrosine-tRNA ligase [Aphanomyces invadans]|eukprot:XP_008868076.1 tyrosine-tRNA ligase [Aphanomyces invadans]